MLYEPKIWVTGSFRKLLHIQVLNMLNETNAISSRYTAVMHFLHQLRGRNMIFPTMWYVRAPKA